MKKTLPFKTIKKNRFGGHAVWFIFNSEIPLRTTRGISRTTSGTRTTLWEPLPYNMKTHVTVALQTDISFFFFTDDPLRVYAAYYSYWVN